MGASSARRIAKRVGVTQPYLSRLRPDKKAIFVAALPRNMDDTRRAFEAAAEGDNLIGEVVRTGWMRIRETVHLSPGADADETAGFFTCGTLGNTLTAIGLPSRAGR